MFDYLDTSAAAKLVVAEPESDELLHYVTAPSRRLVTSDLTRTELVRAVRRVAPSLAAAAREVLDSMTIMTLTTDVFERATLLEPPTMRSLDALHLAAALTLGDDLDAVITYSTPSSPTTTDLPAQRESQHFIQSHPVGRSSRARLERAAP